MPYNSYLGNTFKDMEVAYRSYAEAVSMYRMAVLFVVDVSPTILPVWMALIAH